MRIVFTGGGTGGHITPIVALARAIKAIAEEERILDLELYYFGPEAALPDDLRTEGLIFAHIPAGKVRRYASSENATDLLKTAAGIAVALWKLYVVMPDAIFAKGGYGSFPTLAIACLYRLPVIIHESDAVAGRVSRWAGRFAERIAIAFTSAAEGFRRRKRVALTGIPIRTRLLGGEPEAARELLGVFSSRPVIFVTGGSQGAEVINETVLEALPQLLSRYEVVHQIGTDLFRETRLEATPIITGNEAYYHPFPFLNEHQMRAAYALADVVIARAGATTIFEIAAVGKAAILIPITIAAQDHQRRNAYEYAARGGAVVIEEDNLKPSVLVNEVEHLMGDAERRQTLAKAAQAFAMPDAAEVIAKELLAVGLHELPGGSPPRRDAL